MEEGIHCEQVHETKDHINSLVVSNNIACYIPQGVGIKVNDKICFLDIFFASSF